ncbi:putative MFS family arabinose efflux permease [Humitalea rosea]|uniref:Putative MFS family arabinose efflux permease n=1 Tax=Humitalea rosea TaxID=990373 RepID=A0A2W7KJQ2_9PROT|nr:MFS transporter [Humitalea rosea]PZW48269.1 putative MFS family arabinose efflux permease [Humitalea rosea]
MTAPAPNAFAPLRQRTFAIIWAATVVGNIGVFMRDVASSWLVAEISGSPAAVALVQAASTLPIFLLGIPAGVLADILDRRRLLIGTQIGLALVSGLLAVLALTGGLDVTLLVVLTFVGGLGAALAGPNWQAIVPELVPKPLLRDAVALNSLGFNIARAIGPALGGVVLVTFGAAATYGADVLSYVAVLGALLWWRRPERKRDGLSEHFGGGLRAGLRFARASRELHRVLTRAVIFFVCASAVWALLPLVARNLMGGGAGFYGLLLGGIGGGAVAGALVLPRVRRHLSADGILLGAAICVAAVMLALALRPPQALGLAIAVVLGAAWIAALTTFNGIIQAVLPDWVRGRGLAIYLTTFSGAATLGSLAWGALAEATGVAGALVAGAAALVVLAATAGRLRLPSGEADLAPALHWPEPELNGPVEGDRGPVLILVEYRIDAADGPAFRAALHQLASERRRDGAYAWGLTEDAAAPGQIVEWFLVESWAEHLRQHHRVSAADADVQAEARRFHIGPEAPVVRHLLALPPA